MSGTAAKSKAASKTDKYYQEVKEKIDSMLHEYNEKIGGKITWLHEVDKRHRLVKTNVTIREPDRVKAREIALGIIHSLKSRGLDVDTQLHVTPFESSWMIPLRGIRGQPEIWKITLKVRVRIPKGRRKRNAEPSIS
jgi:hypothetical protein